MSSAFLKIRGARENNLKNLSLELPHDSLTALTGLSGSGKSSLAFDTIYAEGQRRYIETFSSYTRQFFDKVKKPSLDSVENIRPAIAIQQKTRIKSSRSTVGSITDLNDYLKIIWSNLARPLCPSCGIELKRWSARSLAENLLLTAGLKPWLKFMIAARVSLPAAKKAAKAEIDRLVGLGYARCFNAETSSLEEISTQSCKESSLLIVLERYRADGINKTRLLDSLEQAFLLGKGVVSIIETETDRPFRSWLRVVNAPEQSCFRQNTFNLTEFSSNYRCAYSDFALERPRPALFSFNHPLGACPSCKGFGHILTVSREACVPDAGLSLADKALQCWSGPAAKGEYRRLLRFCENNSIPTGLPWRKLSRTQQDQIFEHKSREFCGVSHWFKRIERKAYKMHVRVFLSRYRKQTVCTECGGRRLRKAALAYAINGKSLPDVQTMPVKELLPWIRQLERDICKDPSLVDPGLRDTFSLIIARLEYLTELGLAYISLDRQARTLSGGETQRVNLATALGSELVSTQFVLDEPSVGLHPSDTERLIAAVQKLSRRGNSVLLVEHDIDCISSADHVVELGPQGGAAGGQVTFNDPSHKWPGIDMPALLKRIESLRPRPVKDVFSRGALSVARASARNLKNLNFRIPLEQFVCLSGVSGSGKSTLIEEVLLNEWKRYASGDSDDESITGFDSIQQLLLVDQSPLSKTPRANIATYSGIWEKLRTMLASSESARLRGLGKSSFSFNVDGGRCPACKGSGYVCEDMQFLSDVYIPCEICLGKRFQQNVLEVELKDRSVDQLLQMSIEECSRIFDSEPVVKTATSLLIKLGLGHLTLGHPLSELSGGEAQRLKLATFLQESTHQKSLLIFDEPSTGLHAHDVLKLIELFRLLVSQGHSLICVEHNLLILHASDWIIDLGPGGGTEGGYIMAEGSPASLMAKARRNSSTAEYLFRFTSSQDCRATAEKRTSGTTADNLLISGAREHNLKNIDISLPRNKLVAITGVSGSGKSSIARDIICAEGQRRYLDCLSPYARQFINELRKPRIDHISNIMPTIGVYQHLNKPSGLSTVGTLSEIYNYLRLLYAKAGIQHCPEHPSQAIRPLSAQMMAAEIKSSGNSQVRILAPVIKGKKGIHRSVFERAMQTEIDEVRVDSVFYKPSAAIDLLEKNKPHFIDFTIARFNPGQLDTSLIEESVQQALSIGAGTISMISDGLEQTFSLERSCPICHRGFFKPDPEDLSFHSKRGACPECGGHGTDDNGNLCRHCCGSRLKDDARHIKLETERDRSYDIQTAVNMDILSLRALLSDLKAERHKKEVVENVLPELLSRLDVLISFGLDYLTLNRDCQSLSSGELHRLRLAAAMGSPMSGLLYVFDEPSAGLHPDDSEKIISRFGELRERGNAVFIVEHDPLMISAAEHVLDIGPGGGREGGQIVFNGSMDSFLSSSHSATAEALRDALSDRPAILHQNRPASRHFLKIRDGSCHNITGLSLDVPLSRLVCVAGVSGAGKSSLVHGIICDGIKGALKGRKRWSSPCGTIESEREIEKILVVDQTPIGRNCRSTPASFLGIWDEIRKLFASTTEAKTRGWTASFFSHNTGKGRCPTCGGQGEIKLEMSFLADASIGCEDCEGGRFTEEANSILYLKHSISQILNLTFEEAAQLFSNHRKIHQYLYHACRLGLGYLTLGQASGTLSGGESQRIKLVSELASPQRGHTIYVLDEPTTGLHRSDVARLIDSLNDLVEAGHSVILIEHDVDMLLASDHVIELGPGAGDKGGRTVFSGTCSELLRATSPWANYLKRCGKSCLL